MPLARRGELSPERIALVREFADGLLDDRSDAEMPFQLFNLTQKVLGVRDERVPERPRRVRGRDLRHLEAAADPGEPVVLA